MSRQQKMMAFWRYDLYPYLLWGEIDLKELPKIWKGRLSYYIPTYQSFMVPEFILPTKEGKLLGNLLAELRNQKRLVIKRLDEEYKSHLNRILKENGVDYEEG